jgi:putative DNA primase/helicase
MKNIGDLLTKLNAKRTGKGWIALCPAHDDQKPSLSIAEGRSGKVLFYCFAGCSYRDVIDALKLREVWGNHDES